MVQRRDGQLKAGGSDLRVPERKTDNDRSLLPDDAGVPGGGVGGGKQCEGLINQFPERKVKFHGYDLESFWRGKEGGVGLVSWGRSGR